MSATTSYGIGAVTPGEGYVAWWPKYPAAAQPGIIFCHGAGSLGTMSQEYSSAAQTLNALTDAGFKAIAPDLGGRETWGNSTALDRISAAKTYLQSTMGAKAGKVHLFGISMGGQNAMAWAAANPQHVASLTLFIPVANLTDIVANDRNGAAANANSAYSGGWSETTYGEKSNPLTFATAGKLNGIPVRIHYGLTDTICVKAETEALISKLTNVVSVSHPGGHDMDSYTPQQREAVVNFIKTSS